MVLIGYEIYKNVYKKTEVHAWIQKIFSVGGGGGGGGGGGFQIPRRGLTEENFNMAKINNLAIPGGGGGSPDLLSPHSGSAHGSGFQNDMVSKKQQNIRVRNDWKP